MIRTPSPGRPAKGIERMTITRIALVTLCLTAGASGVCAQPAVIVPQGQPLESPPIAYPQGPCAPSKCHADLDPTCMPDCYGYNRLAIPYELSFRTGPSFIIGGNRFDSVLNTGIFNEIAAKGFCYSADHSRAWKVRNSPDLLLKLNVLPVTNANAAGSTFPASVKILLCRDYIPAVGRFSQFRPANSFLCE
jgi:hypothetical protein